METLADRQLSRLTPAFDALEPGADPTLRESDRADFQVNGAMALAKRLGRNPREVAEEIVASIERDDLIAALEVAGRVEGGVEVVHRGHGGHPAAR